MASKEPRVEYSVLRRRLKGEDGEDCPVEEDWKET